jgi:MFS family permease
VARLTDVRTHASGLRDPQILRCLAGSFLLRAAASGAVALIAFYIADLETAHQAVRGSLVIALATGLFFAAEIVGALVFGALCDRHGERRYMRLGPIFGAGSAVLMGLAAAVPIVIVARVFQGLSTAAAIPATLAILSRHSGHDEALRGRVMGVFEVSAIGGMAAGFVMVGTLYDRFGSNSFFVMVGVYVLSLLLLWSVGSVGPREAVAERAGARMRFLRSPKALRLVPAWVAVNAVLGVWLTHVTYQLKRADDPTQLLVGGYSGAQISTYGAATLVLFVAGIAAWGWSMGRLGSLRVMTISLFGMFVFLPGVYYLNWSSPEEHTRIAITLAISGAALLVMSGFTPAALAYLSRIAEEHAGERGAIMGVYSVLLGVGQAIGAMTGGLVAHRWSISGMVGLSLLFTVASAIAVAALIRAERAPVVERPGWSVSRSET